MNLAIIGLGVMGRNLALNFRDAGHRLAVWDPWPEARSWGPNGIVVCDDLKDLIAQLETPRTILVMLKAGDPVTKMTQDLISVLSPGDTVIDGGNSDFKDTEARARLMQDRSLNFAGLGISGGAEGARHGPSMMLGCPVIERDRLLALPRDVAANRDDRACVDWFGSGGAGHFVKMVHNGIEYAIMQAIAESWALLEASGYAPHDAADMFGEWATGDLNGYLIEITAEVLRATDRETGASLIHIVDDAADQKGTGGWCAATALELGVPVPAIAEAVALRQISSHPGLRSRKAPETMTPPAERSTGDIHDGLAAAVATALAQGAHLLTAGSETYGWEINLQSVSQVWRAGSILRMDLLELLDDPQTLIRFIASRSDALRRTVIATVDTGIPAPVLSSCISYYDAGNTLRLPTALVQLQRDRFGAHGLKKPGRDGTFHGPWHTEPT